jgi:CRISPR-associated exonuclease Cas4
MTAPLPISALQHLLFCERQCGLIHLERLWEENRFTAEGRVMHEKGDEGRAESRPRVLITCSPKLRSEVRRLHGVANVVKLHLKPDGTWQPFPVEYIRGKPTAHDADLVQLCAQALCQEEAFEGRPDLGFAFAGS